MRWAGQIAHKGEKRKAQSIVVGIPEGTIVRWEDNIKLVLQKWDGTVYTGSIWLGIGISWAVASTVMNLQ